MTMSRFIVIVTLTYNMQAELGKTEQGWTKSPQTFQIGIQVSDLIGLHQLSAVSAV